MIAALGNRGGEYGRSVTMESASRPDHRNLRADRAFLALTAFWSSSSPSPIAVSCQENGNG